MLIDNSGKIKYLSDIMQNRHQTKYTIYHYTPKIPKFLGGEKANSIVAKFWNIFFSRDFKIILKCIKCGSEKDLSIIHDVKNGRFRYLVSCKYGCKNLRNKT